MMRSNRFTPAQHARSRARAGLRAAGLAVLLGTTGALALAQAAAPPMTGTVMPAEVESALARARVPRDALTVLVVDADGQRPARLSHRAQVEVLPASLMKLVTTYAALDLLGPAYTWSTPVFIDGAVRDGTLYGNLVIQGQGDPTLVVERLWLLMRRVQALGIQTIAGDIVLDRSAFKLPPSDPASFDGEPSRPYNTAPDALLVNFKSLVLRFVPDVSAKLARVGMEPPLAGVQATASVPLTLGTDCGDWRASLRAELEDPARVTLSGSYPLACGERNWPLAYTDPRTFNHRAVEAMWRGLGGRLQGQVRDGTAPAGTAPVVEARSPALAEVIRDINKFSNNVMAQQLFLTLGLGTDPDSGRLEGSRTVLRRWWQERIGRPGVAGEDPPVLDNGSGLSRSERISAQALGRMLQVAWGSPMMPDLMASLPLAGVDGTLRRSRARPASAHLKTGSLVNVTGIAGYVHGASGRRYVLVAIVNHPLAGSARPALDALVDWTARDQ